MTRLVRPCVCLVTDRRQLTPEARTVADEIAALDRWLDEAIEAGVDLIQIRERDLEAADLKRLVSAVAARARGSRTRVLVNDRVDVALAASADGVHLRSDGPPSERVRPLSRPGWLVGQSVHTPEEGAAASSADYLIFGAVFPTTSKPAGAVPRGLSGLRAAVSATATPVLAIGGLTIARAGDCARAGAAGVAAIGLFLPPGRTAHAMGIRRAADELRRVLQ